MIITFHYRGALSVSLHQFKIVQYHYVMNTIVIIIVIPTLGQVLCDEMNLCFSATGSGEQS